jgi:hypothetical protein
MALVLVVVACGPGMATPTTSAPEASEPQATTVTATQQTPEISTAPTDDTEPTAEEPANLPVADDDWHVLGSADADVVIFEYSDFQ